MPVPVGSFCFCDPRIAFGAYGEAWRESAEMVGSRLCSGANVRLRFAACCAGTGVCTGGRHVHAGREAASYIEPHIASHDVDTLKVDYGRSTYQQREARHFEFE